MGGIYRDGNAWTKEFSGDSLREFWEFSREHKDTEMSRVYELAKQRWKPANSAPEPEPVQQEVIFL